MERDKEGEKSGSAGSGVYTVFRERGHKTSISLETSFDTSYKKQDDLKNKPTTWVLSCDIAHYLTLILLGLLSWGVLWCAFGPGWGWDGPWWRLGSVAGAAWAAGQLLQAATSLPPLLAALATGVLAGHLGYLDMRDQPEIDGFLRRIYPVVILGKGSLAWDLGYMRAEWRQLAALGVFPWALEVLTVAVCTHLLLGFPWIWGFLLGSFYCSVSCPVLMPSLARLHAAAAAAAAPAAAPAQNWPQLLYTAGGIDTALSVGFFGMFYSYALYPADDTYRIAKAVLTMFAGVALGAAWGSLAGLVPWPNDAHVAPLRVLLVLIGGLYGNYITSMFGWMGTGGVAVLVCNATAARRWARDGDAWKLNQNPAATTYRVLWALCEPALFAYTGTYFTLDDKTLEYLPCALALLFGCLTVRLAAAAATCWSMTFRERLVVCCLWTPKSIVEAVLCPLLLNTLILQGVSSEDPRLEYAEGIVRLTVVAIVISTPAGFLLTRLAVPRLLAARAQGGGDDITSQKYERRKSASLSNTTPNEDF